MKPFTSVAIFFLGLVSALQLVRLLQGWEVIVNGVSVDAKLVTQVGA